MTASAKLESLVTFRELDFTRTIIDEELYSSTVLFAYLPVVGLQRVRDVVVRALRRNRGVRLITNEYHYPDTENWMIIGESGPIRVSKLKD
jgi:hypothetical protein